MAGPCTSKFQSMSIMLFAFVSYHKRQNSNRNYFSQIQTQFRTIRDVCLSSLLSLNFVFMKGETFSPITTIICQRSNWETCKTVRPASLKLCMLGRAKVGLECSGCGISDRDCWAGEVTSSFKSAGCLVWLLLFFLLLLLFFVGLNFLGESLHC